VKIVPCDAPKWTLTTCLDAKVRNELATILLQPGMAYKWVRPCEYNEVLAAKTGARRPSLSAAFSDGRWSAFGRECVAPAFVVLMGAQRRVMYVPKWQ
jgi:hypothetical protein